MTKECQAHHLTLLLLIPHLSTALKTFTHHRKLLLTLAHRREPLITLAHHRKPLINFAHLRKHPVIVAHLRGHLMIIVNPCKTFPHPIPSRVILCTSRHPTRRGRSLHLAKHLHNACVHSVVPNTKIESCVPLLYTIVY